MRLFEFEKNAIKNKYLLFSIIYLLAHAWILLIPNAVFWDDWGLHNTDPEELLALFERAGSMFNIAGHGHVFMQGIWLGWYKVGVLFFFFGSGLLLNKIMERSGVISEVWRIVVVVIFLIFPLNPARVAQINFFYAACYFSFFLAWLAMDKQKIAAMFLFYFSFNTNSILVLYAIPFIDYIFRNGYWRKEEIIGNCGRLTLFASLPFLYFLIKTKFYTPSGEYAAYNTGFSLIRAETSLLGQIKDMLAYMPGDSSLLAAVAILIAVILFARLAFIDAKKRKSAAIACGLGFVLIVLACFPYWVVGHIPTIHEWTSRHQLLMPLGVAFVIIFICIALGNFLGRGFLYFIVIFSVVIWINNYKDFYLDWKKQEQLVRLFSDSNKLKDAGLVVFRDETTDLNAIGRTNRPYEWNGLMVLSFGDESRFGVLDSELLTYCEGGYDKYFVAHYKAKNHKRMSECVPTVVRIFIDGAETTSLLFFRKNVNYISIEVL
jgi:hypothetical protein